MKKNFIYISLITLVIMIICCSTIDDNYILINTQSKKSISITSEHIFTSSFPFEIMLFAFNNNSYSKTKPENITLDIYIKDYGFFNTKTSIGVISHKNGLIEINENHIDRFNEDYITFQIENEYIEKENTLLIAERPKEILDFPQLYSNDELDNNRYFIYVQGTSPIVETVETIYLRPIILMIRENYQKSFAYLYNLGFTIDRKSEKLAEYIKDNIPEDALIDVIGESQGALVVRNMMMKNPKINNQIRKFISMCGVNEGSYIANDDYLSNIIRNIGNLNSKNSNNLYGYLVEAIDNIVFRIYPELLQMRENSEFIKNINKNLTKEIADKMYLIAANLKPETNFGDLMARVSSELLMSRSDIIPDSRKFIINFMNHAQAIFSKTAAKIMYKILNDFY